MEKMSKIKEMLDYALVDKTSIKNLLNNKLDEDEKIIEAYK